MVPNPLPLAYAVYAFINVDNCERPLMCLLVGDVIMDLDFGHFEALWPEAGSGCVRRCSSLYTPHLWWNYKKMYVTKLQTTFNNILNRNTGLSKHDSTSGTCAFTNTQCCQSTMCNIVFNFMCRLNKYDNAFITYFTLL